MRKLTIRKRWRLACFAVILFLLNEAAASGLLGSDKPDHRQLASGGYVPALLPQNRMCMTSVGGGIEPAPRRSASCSTTRLRRRFACFKATWLNPSTPTAASCRLLRSGVSTLSKLAGGGDSPALCQFTWKSIHQLRRHVACFTTMNETLENTLAAALCLLCCSIIHVANFGSGAVLTDSL